VIIHWEKTEGLQKRSGAPEKEKGQGDLGETKGGREERPFFSGKKRGGGGEGSRCGEKGEFFPGDRRTRNSKKKKLDE